MNGLVLLLISTAFLLFGYFVYSKLLGKILGLDPSRPTPAHTRTDGVDYVPAHPAVLFGHHFAAIAGAGPIVGPILAAEFGWVSVILWIMLGCVFIGAAHDMIALFLSVRHDGQSIGTVIGDVLGRPGRIFFLLFSFVTLVLVCAEFTRQIAATFVVQPGIATASLLFIGEAVLFGLCVYRLKMSVLLGSLIFVPLVFASVWLGGLMPIDLVGRFGFSPESAQAVWTLVLLAYCFFASTLPVWLLLQPRDYLNAYLLYAMMALGFLGVVFAHPTFHLDAFAGFSVIGRSGGSEMLFPFLFVTVACGACSGFHALVASGTTAKQLDSEKHIRLIGYGGMLLEGVLATLALVGVASYFSSQADYQQVMNVAKSQEPVQVFAASIAGFCGKFGVPVKTAEAFMLLAVSAFLMTSVDAATRLARFSWQELFVAMGYSEKKPTASAPVRSSPFAVLHNMYVGTGIVVGLVVFLLLGNPQAAKSLWTVFASANQQLAALTLLAATLWFLQNHKPCWVTLVPMCFMMSVSFYALVAMFLRAFGLRDYTRIGATGFLILLAGGLVVFTVSKLGTLLKKNEDRR